MVNLHWENKMKAFIIVTQWKEEEHESQISKWSEEPVKNWKVEKKQKSSIYIMGSAWNVQLHTNILQYVLILIY